MLSTSARSGACGAVGLAAMQLGALMGHKARAHFGGTRSQRAVQRSQSNGLERIWWSVE